MKKHIYLPVAMGIFLLAATILTSFSSLEKATEKTLANAPSIVEVAHANPDYICVKHVSGTACQPQSCGPWTGNSRICTGIQSTLVGYHNIRVSCEPWYSSVLIGSSGGTSGRQEADHPIWSSTEPVCDENGCSDVTTSYAEACTVTEVDNTPPVGDPEVSYN